MDPDKILDGCGFFAAVEGAARRKLLDMATLVHFSKGEQVFRAGDPCPGVFIVGSGLARVYLLAPSGKEQVLHLVSPGGTFAEVAAIGGFPCPAFAEAVEDLDCLLLPVGPFRQALQDDHGLCLQLLVSYSRWVKTLVDLLENVTLRDAAGRVARHLLELADTDPDNVRLVGLKKHLASRLNLTSETLSRTFRKLTEAGLIGETQDGRLVITDPQGLRDVADPR